MKSSKKRKITGEFYYPNILTNGLQNICKLSLTKVLMQGQQEKLPIIQYLQSDMLIFLKYILTRILCTQLYIWIFVEDPSWVSTLKNNS